MVMKRERTHAVPEKRGTATEYATRLAEAYCARAPKERRKKLGQFFTPADVARFMAAPVLDAPRRVLDPAAGTGVLLCALVDRFAARKRSSAFHADAYEVDAGLTPLLREALAYAATLWPGFSFTIHEEDFVEAWAQNSCDLFAAGGDKYDFVIANPPYFKVRSDSRLALLTEESGAQGRTNIYSLMMSAAADLLAAQGEMVFIVPRSFCNGLYFKRFRQQLLGRVSLKRVHVFTSRRAAFRADDVLQENVIVWLARRPQPERIAVSSSGGVTDLDKAREGWFKLRDVIPDRLVIQLPTSPSDRAILEKVRAWPDRLHSFDLQISTGPIVAYRSSEWIGPRGNYPLVLLDNIRPMQIDWPLENGKPQYVRECSAAQKWMVPNANYVLLRRFSAKEDPRRLQAAPLLADQFGAPWLGIENHVNFIHRPGATLSEEEALGLAALFNSDLLDSYFRIINGNTQVNATDLRALRLPPLDVIVRIGTAVRAGAHWRATLAHALTDAREGITQEASGVQT